MAAVRPLEGRPGTAECQVRRNVEANGLKSAMRTAGRLLRSLGMTDVARRVSVEARLSRQTERARNPAGDRGGEYSPRGRPAEPAKGRSAVLLCPENLIRPCSTTPAALPDESPCFPEQPP